MERYALGITAEFPARHFLVGGDFGAEGELHGHDYRVEVMLEADSLDAHGFVADIVEVRAVLDRLVARYRDSVLNELTEFSGTNPGCETFARVFAHEMARGLEPAPDGPTEIVVKIWESRDAWASCRIRLTHGK